MDREIQCTACPAWRPEVELVPCDCGAFCCSTCVPAHRSVCDVVAQALAGATVVDLPAEDAP